jgi:hypothetical protein
MSDLKSRGTSESRAASRPSRDRRKQRPLQTAFYIVIGIALLAFIIVLAVNGGYPLIYELSLILEVTGLILLIALVFKKSHSNTLRTATAVVTAVALAPSLIQGWRYWQGSTLHYPLTPHVQDTKYSYNAECFANNGTLTIKGYPEATGNVVQCRHTQTGIALTYSVMPPLQLGEHDVRIAGLDGTFGIDQDPQNPMMPNANVIWTVVYAGHTICTIDVHWGQAGKPCESNGEVPFAPNEPLVISQVANFGLKHNGQVLYAGIINPELLLKEHE